MAHILILGTTESGKTTCGKRLAERWLDNGVDVIVLDPLNDPGWIPQGYTLQSDGFYRETEDGPGIFQTSDVDEFLSAFWASRSCAVFIDEAGDAVGRYDVVMQKTATRGRHWGHSVHFLTQRGSQIAVTVRDQCTRMFLFRTGPRDAKTHAEEWAQPELLNAPYMPKGCYYYVTRFGELKRGSLFGEQHRGIDTDSGNGGRKLSTDQAPDANATSQHNDRTAGPGTRAGPAARSNPAAGPAAGPDASAGPIAGPDA
jgi:hypothetical protein